MKYVKGVVIVVVVFILLSFSPAKSISIVNATLFGVHGVVFSIAVSQIISLNTSSVRNQDARKKILSAISSTLKGLTLSFILAVALVLLFQVLSKIEMQPLCIAGFTMRISAGNIVPAFLSLFLLKTSVSFIYLRTLALKIEEQIIKEEVEGI